MDAALAESLELIRRYEFTEELASLLRPTISAVFNAQMVTKLLVIRDLAAIPTYRKTFHGLQTPVDRLHI